MNAKNLFTGRMRNATFAVMALVLLSGGFFAVGALTSPAFASPCPAGSAYVAGVGTPAEQVLTGQCVHLTVVITHQEQTTADPQLVAEGFTPSCWVNCNGITYTLDPTVYITNAGHDFEQYKIFGVSGTIGSAGTQSVDVATVMGLTSSATAPATGDYSASGPCKTTSPGNEIETGGLTDIVGTVTAGAAGTSLTTTIAHTFTAAETDNTVQTACLQTEVATSADVIIYAEGTFGPDSLVSGNTIAITWTVTRT